MACLKLVEICAKSIPQTAATRQVIVTITPSSNLINFDLLMGTTPEVTCVFHDSNQCWSGMIFNESTGKIIQHSLNTCYLNIIAIPLALPIFTYLVDLQQEFFTILVPFS
ncbi:hypothetical protein Pan161_48110 [Gimesia algae]|uniref:Uncharacterized protein n=1 Tax=Gimesia algae TaxID=2527971 RepID=A0A517VJE8_9PLAN|nr:hypothetical protein Pan161_48110 [Gimesia algae]